MRFSTKALRAGCDLDSQYRSVAPPLYQTSTFSWESLEEHPEFEYTRYSNPNQVALGEAIASLENGEHCVLLSSGMAAIAGAFSLLGAGDHLLMASDIYGGTANLARKVLPKQGISVSEFCAFEPGSIRDVVTAHSKMLIFESPINPNLRVVDIAAVCEVAKSCGLIVVFDNTFASPALQNPLDLGADIVMHSTTKYISGHSDVIGGALILNDDAMHEAIAGWNTMVGATPSPFDCWLTTRGLKTLGCRMEKHCQNAQAVAEFLAGHPKVERVHYPGLPTHPDHATAQKQMRGFGGMLAVEVKGGRAEARRVLESVKVFTLAASLGGVESLIGYPPQMSHAALSEEERLAKGIPPNMLRVSVGIEDVRDLIEDLDQALG
jgi:cystathionine beta-lyase/cystathionine gamma-synthase